MNNNIQLEYYDFDIYSVQSIIKYISEHLIQFLLLLLVPVIIYVVDHISAINSMIFSMPSPIPITVQKPHEIVQSKNKHNKISKKRNIVKK